MDKVRDYLELLLQVQDTFFQKGVVLYGQKANQLAEEFYEEHIPTDEEIDEDIDLPMILLLQTPEKCAPKALCNAILERIGVDHIIKKRETLLEKEKNVLHYVRVLNVKMLIFKDFDRILKGKPVALKKVLTEIKTLMNFGVAVVLTGTEDICRVVEKEEQLLRRFIFFNISH